MQTLFILRHAKAVPWSPLSEDFPRKLDRQGIRDARKVAEWMVENLELPQRILCSPSQRTRETLAPLLAIRPELDAVTHFVPQIYHAPASLLRTLLDAAFAAVDRVLIVGHNPGFEQLVADVIHPTHYPDFDRLPTGTLAVVGFDPDWAENSERGTLQHFIRGKQLPGK